MKDLNAAVKLVREFRETAQTSINQLKDQMAQGHYLLDTNPTYDNAVGTVTGIQWALDEFNALVKSINRDDAEFQGE